MPSSTGAAGDMMDGIYRHQRFIYDLTRRYYLLGRDALIDDLAALPGHAVLEIGCGTARNLIVAARRFPKARFLGVDVSAAMLDTARGNITRAGLADRITIAQADATAFDAQSLFGIGTFDRIFCSYVLSMVPDWPAVIEHGIGLLAEGGRLEAVDFGQFSRYPRPFAAGMKRWLRRFHVHPIEDFRARLETIALRHALELRHAPLYRDYAVRACLERPRVAACHVAITPPADSRHRRVMSG